MTDRLSLPSRYRRTVEALLREHVPHAEVWAYGSRVNGRSHEGSDLDLVVRGHGLGPLGVKFIDLVEALQESNIPILVQAHDWAMLPGSFHREIERDYVVMQKGAKPTAQNGWRNVTLAEVCSSVRYGYTASASDSPTGTRFLRVTDIASSHLDWNTVPYCEIDEEQYNRFALRPGDIVIARMGTIGVSAFIDKPVRAVPASYLIRHRLDEAIAHPRFVSYVLRSPMYWQFIHSYGSAGAVQPNINAQVLAGFEFPLPPLPQQRAIAHVLGTLDDKIELNRRMNQTLEAMARALFKSWFVDFDPVRAKMEGRHTGLPPDLAALFPDRLVDSELGPVPAGWGVRPLGDIIELAYGKALRAVDRKGGSVPVYGSNGQVGWHDKKLVAGPGIVVGRKGNPGVVTWAHGDFFPIDTTFYVVPRDAIGGLPFLFFALTSQDLPFVSADSAVPGLNRNLAYMNQQLVPDKHVLAKFNDYAAAIFARCHRLQDESRSLAAQRDILLPRLVSGEMRVGGVEVLKEGIAKQ